MLDPSTKDPLRAVARFRNRLVHLCWDVEDERVHECPRNSLGDIETFVRAIADRSW